jgi:hypothetical protein
VYTGKRKKNLRERDHLEDLGVDGKNDIGGACSAYGGEERRIQGFAEKPERKRPLGRPRSRWEDNIKMDLQEVGCGCMNWIQLAQDKGKWCALENVAMNLRVPQNVGNFLTTCKLVSFSKRALLHRVSKQ